MPDTYSKPYMGKSSRPHFAGMISAVDEGVMNVTRALQRKGMADSTLIVVSADNGGPVWIDGGLDSESGSWAAEHESDAIGASNYPRRGGKHLLYDGGVRVSALLHAPWYFPPRTQGTVYSNLMHAVDWFATFSTVAGLDPQPAGNSPSGQPWLPIDGVSHLDAMMTRGGPASSSPPRSTIVLDNQTDIEIDEYGVNAGIVVVGDDGVQWKLIVNSTDSGWSQRQPVDACNSSGSWTHFSNRLYNLSEDPREQHDLFETNRLKANELAARLVELSAGRYRWPLTGHRGSPKNATRPDGTAAPVWAPWLADGSAP